MNNTTEKRLDPVARIILEKLSIQPKGEFMVPDDIARIFAETRRRPSDKKNLFLRYRQAVREQAIFLARQGKIEIVRKGEVVDPDNFKGLWKMRLKLS